MEIIFIEISLFQKLYSSFLELPIGSFYFFSLSAFGILWHRTHFQNEVENWDTTQKKHGHRRQNTCSPGCLCNICEYFCHVFSYENFGTN